MDSLLPTKEALIESSAKYARAALDAHHATDQDQVVVFAGTALEHLLKACLVKRHPALILDLKSPNSWKTLRYVFAKDEVSPEKIRTVGLQGAFDRVKGLVKSDANPPDIESLVELRNGEVHLGGQVPVDDRILVAFLRQMDACLKDLGLARETFWVQHVAVVDTFLSKETDRVKKMVAQKISQSQLQFKSSMAQYSEEAVQAIMRGNPRSLIGEEPFICPVCHSMGIAIGNHVMEYDLDYDVMEDVVDVHEITAFYAREFLCDVCGLRLDNPEELSEAGLSIPTNISKIDPGDIAAYEYALSKDD